MEYASPKPFKAHFLYPPRSSPKVSRPNVKASPKPHKNADGRKLVGVLDYPFFLAGKAHADEKDTGRVAVDLLYHSAVLSAVRRYVEIPVMSAAKEQIGKLTP